MKINHVLRFPDDNTSGSTSTSTATAGATADNAAAKVDDTKGPTLNEAVQDALKKSDPASASSTDEDAAKSGSETEQDQGAKADASKEGQEKTEGKEEAQGQEGDKKEEGEEDKGPVPYDRFKEVNEKLATISKDVEALKPRAEWHDKVSTYLTQNNITPEQFSQVLKVQALLNTDPESALKELMPIVDALQGFVGGKLPKDLQEAVDAEQITPALAKELASMRAKLQFGEKRTELTQKQQQERAMQEFQGRVTNAISTWESSKRSLDPDYKPGSDKWNDVKDKFTAMLHELDAKGQYVNPVANEQQAIALMEKAYTTVGARFAQLGRKPATKKPLSSNGSSSATKIKPIEEYATMREAVAAHVR